MAPPMVQLYHNRKIHSNSLLFKVSYTSNFAPPIRTFIKENSNIHGKKLAVFTCYSGGGADKAIEKMKKYIGIEEFEAELILVDPKENMKVEDDEKIDVFCQRLMKSQMN